MKKIHPLLDSSFLWVFNISNLSFPSPAERCHLFSHLRVWDTRSFVGKRILKKNQLLPPKLSKNETQVMPFIQYFHTQFDLR